MGKIIMPGKQVVLIDQLPLLLYLMMKLMLLLRSQNCSMLLKMSRLVLLAKVFPNFTPFLQPLT